MAMFIAAARPGFKPNRPQVRDRHLKFPNTGQPLVGCVELKYRQPVRLRLEARRKELMHVAVGPLPAPCCRWIDR